MAGQNDLGPFGPGVQETYEEPASFGDSGGAAYSWFKDCSSELAEDGTAFTAQWANRIMKYIRRACDGMGIPRNETDGDRLLKAIQKADKALEDVGDALAGVSMHDGVNTTTNAYKIRRLRGGDGINVTLDPETAEAVIAVGGGGVSLATLAPILMVEQRRASGASPRGLASGTWTRRDINTVLVNQITGASLANEQLTVPAGTYRAHFLGCATSSGHHRTRLYNVTAGATLGIGNSGDSSIGSGATVNTSHGIARFTLAAQSILELQTFSVGTASQGDPEDTSIAPDSHVDGWIEITKEA